MKTDKERKGCSSDGALLLPVDQSPEQSRSFMPEEFSSFCQELWQMLGGKDMVKRFVVEVENKRGRVYLVGGAVRSLVLMGLERKPRKPEDVDLVIEGLELDEVREIASDIWKKDNGFQIGRREPRKKPGRTLPVIRRPYVDEEGNRIKGRRVADLVPARDSSGQPNRSASIETHLREGIKDLSFNRMAILIEIYKEEVVVNPENLIDPFEGREKLRGAGNKELDSITPANCLRVFRFLVEGMIGEEEKGDVINKLRGIFCSPDDFIILRNTGREESEEQWNERTKRRRDLPPTRVRVFPMGSAEGVVSLIARLALEQPWELWYYGWKTGLFDVLFPVLSSLKNERAVFMGIENGLKGSEARERWFEIIFREAFLNIFAWIKRGEFDREAVKISLQMVKYYLGSSKDFSKIARHLKKQPHILLLAITNFLPWGIVKNDIKGRCGEWLKGENAQI